MWIPKKKTRCCGIEGFPSGNYFTASCCEGIQCNLMSFALSLNCLEMGHHFQITDEECQKAMAQGANEK